MDELCKEDRFLSVEYSGIIVSKLLMIACTMNITEYIACIRSYRNCILTGLKSESVCI